MKKLLVGLLLAVVTLSCTKDDVVVQNENAIENQSKTANRLSTGSNVKLLKAWIGSSQRYGFVQDERRFEVEVRNLAYGKVVALVHKMSDGTWKEYPLAFASSTPDNTEIWAAEVILSGSLYEGAPAFIGFGDEFAIKYQVNGQEFWDNNNSKNYSTKQVLNQAGQPIQYGMMLRDGIQVLADAKSATFNQYSGYGTSFYVMADVKNIGFQKEVKVVYTTDNWATNNVAPLSYLNSYAVGQYHYQNGVNAYGIERWSVPAISIPESVTTIQYAIVYKVNGVEYWDNNFGQNYTINKTVYNN